MTTEDRARQVHDELVAALEAVAEHGRVSERLTRARATAADAAAAALRSREQLAVETDDVQALESFSPTRIWATLRGSRDTDLDQAQAEQQAAQYAVARSEAEHAAAQDEVRRAEAELASYGDVAGRRDRALRAKEEWMVASGGPGAEDLTRIAGELAAARSQATEIAEASAAGERAAVCLAEAARVLGSAGDWATYDTFFGGGLITDAVKYDRMDQAQRLLHRADQALRRFASELADTGIQVAIQGLAVDGLLQAFDVWFDNIFSDWAVKDRIRDADARTRQAAHLVAQLRQRLAHRAGELTAQQAALTAERERLVSLAG